MILACDQFEDTTRILFGESPDKGSVEDYTNPDEANRRIHELAEKAECVLITKESSFISQSKIAKEKISLLPRLEALYWSFQESVDNSDCLVLSLGVGSCLGGLIKGGQLSGEPKIRNTEVTLQDICRGYIEKNSDLKAAVEGYFREKQPTGEKEVLSAFIAALGGEIIEELPLFWPPIVLENAVGPLIRLLAELGTSNRLLLTDWAGYGNLPTLMEKAGYSVLGSSERAFDHAVRGLIRWRQNQTAKAERTNGTSRGQQKPAKDETKKAEVRVSPAAVNFSNIDVGKGLVKATIEYENLGEQSLEGSIPADAANFLKITPANFSQERGKIEIALDTGKLVWGRSYSSRILISYNGADNPLSIPVEIRVNPIPPPSAEKKAEIRCDTAAVNFVDIGVDSGIIEKSISYQKFGEQSLVGSISCSAPDLLKVTPSSLSPSKGDIHVTLDTSKLKWEQVYSTEIRIDYNGSDSPVEIPIQIKVNPPKAVEKAELRCDPPDVNFAGVGVNGGIVRKKVEYWKVGEPTLAGSIVSEAASFLSVTPRSLSSDSGSINVELDTGQLKWGQNYSGHVRIDYNGADSPKRIPIRVKVKQKRNWPSYLFLGVLLPLAIYVIVKTFPDSHPPPPPLLLSPAVEHVIAARDITDLNVRAGPTASDKLLAPVKLRHGETLKLLGSSKDRYRVLLRLNGKELDGWVIKEPFLTQEELLVRVTGLLATNGFGNLTTGLGPNAQLIISGEVKYTADVEKVRGIAQSVSGIANIDVRNLRVSPTSPNEQPAGERKDGPAAPEPIPRPFSHSVPPHLWTRGTEQLQQMINYALIDGGITREADIVDAKRQIEALNIANELPAVDRNAARVANQKGIEQQKRGNYLEAIPAFQEAYQANRADVEVVNNLGYAYLLRGDVSSSEQALSLALLLVPDRVSAWFNLGQVKARQRNEAMAVACFANAYRFTPDKKRAYGFLKSSSNSDSDAAVRAALVKTLGLKLVRDIEEKPPSPPRGGSTQAPQQVGSGWIAHRILVRLQDAGFGNIKVQQTGPQEITLSGQASSEDEAQKIREIAGREARRQAVVVRWTFDIAK
jgi:hypothetical protein